MVFAVIAKITDSHQPFTDDAFLLVADERRDKILQVDTDTMTTQVPLPINVTSQQPQVLAYDWLRRDVYWTSGHYRNTIFMYPLANNVKSPLHTDTYSSMVCSLNFRS